MSPAAADSPDRSLTLDEIRAELRTLVSLADTAELPKPSVIHDAWHAFGAGQEWQVNHPCQVGKRTDFRRWTVRTLDHDDVANVVYLNTPGHMEDDFTAAKTSEARQFAMAILAACDRADHQAASVPTLGDRRRTKDPTKGDQVT